jgi:hypothetical protein
MMLPFDAAFTICCAAVAVCHVLLPWQLLAPPDQHTSGTVDVLALAPLSGLTSLTLHTSTRLYLPLTPKARAARIAA